MAAQKRRLFSRDRASGASFPEPDELPILRDAAVPEAEKWPARGISGQPTTPGYENTWVLLERIDEPVQFPYAYRLWLPSSEIPLTGEPIGAAYDLSDDYVHPSGVGGLIDLVSRALRVEWSVGDQEWDAASQWYAQRVKELNDSLTLEERANLAAIHKVLPPATPRFLRPYL